jgi:dihydroorotate dehydrogenase (fumarate)
VRYARALQDAGADALELNVYLVAADRSRTGAEVEQRYLDVISSVRAEIGIPLAVKVGPFFSSFANMATRMVRAGADGLVLFNRFYQPDLDLERFTVTRRLTLSTSNDLRLPMRWIAILHRRLACSLALSSGVHTADDAIRALLVGADVVMMTSALLERGPEHVAQVQEDLRTWMTEHGYEAVEAMRGSMSQASVPDPAAFERANYVRTITSYTSRARA